LIGLSSLVLLMAWFTAFEQCLGDIQNVSCQLNNDQS
jgi:hypothetical protein